MFWFGPRTLGDLSDDQLGGAWGAHSGNSNRLSLGRSLPVAAPLTCCDIFPWQRPIFLLCLRVSLCPTMPARMSFSTLDKADTPRSPQFRYAPDPDLSIR
jgi:hypothetical protein